MFSIDKSINKIIGKKRHGGRNDFDFDGVPNRIDCQSRNTMRQDLNYDKLIEGHQSYQQLHAVSSGNVGVIQKDGKKFYIFQGKLYNAQLVNRIRLGMPTQYSYTPENTVRWMHNHNISSWEDLQNFKRSF